MFHGKPSGGFTRNTTSDSALLGRLLGRLGVPSTALSLLLAHAVAVARDADRIGLLAADEVIVRRHTADSLLFALVRAPQPGESWVDVGSGAGFPGLVLAATYPNSAFTLLEPQKRRAGFLELQTADLGLANVRVETRRLDEVEDAIHEVAVARALKEPGRALRSMVRVVARGGLAIVAVGSGPATPADPRVYEVRVDDIDDVDSPGRFFMMSHEA
jgi:16S rRNA (guanine527-N7)-methyltransferase